MSTYIPIQAITLTSNTTNVEFTNIPQTYTDLVLVVSAKDSGTGTVNTNIRVGNGSFDTASSYSYTFLGGSGSAASSNRSSNITSTLWGAIGTTNNTVAILHLMNYSNITTNKTILSRNFLPDQASGQAVSAWVCLWRSTSAINQIQLYPGGQQFASGSTFTLYGIGSGTIKALGGQVYTSAGFAYHVFRQSGIFSPSTGISADILVIAGGGAGGGDRGGGGGSGGYRYLTSQSLGASDYPVIIGAGGSGITTATGTKGINSSIGNISSSGGGAGWVSSPTGANANGGSGGGGWGASDVNATNTGGSGNAGSYSPVEGYAGGDGEDGGSRRAGGGGGAGGAGTNGSSGGTGGSGSNALSAWATITNTGVSGFYAGGGGGGAQTGTPAGGSGGGGGGVASGSGNNATANTGSGGGGGGDTGAGRVGGNGGSGLVIVRYAL